ncbi:MAG: hypothetical protein HYW26_03240 [Candidatus Aenigmarchaeota archaeon]|nr:hypothetical protein [Candidatus Aenigmarchaeota archaeon]
MKPIRRIEDDYGRIFVVDEKGNYYEEFSHVIGGKFYKRLEIPKVVKQDIIERVKDALLV